MTSHAGLESYPSQTLCNNTDRSTRDTCHTLHSSGPELEELLATATASWKLEWNCVLWNLVSGQSNDDARTDADESPRRGGKDRLGQSCSGAVRTMTTANDVARLNKPTAFSAAEDEFSDWDFALTCFVGTMDATLLKELQAVAFETGAKRIRQMKLEERERTLCNILAFQMTKAPRKMVREIPDQNGYEAYRSLVLRYGSRDARGETTLLIKVMNFHFGRHRQYGIEVRRVQPVDQRSRWHTSQLLPTYLTRSSEPLMWQERQSCCGLTWNWTVSLTQISSRCARRSAGTSKQARNSNSKNEMMTRWTSILSTEKWARAKAKERARARESPKAKEKEKEKAKTMRKERVPGKASRVKNRSEEHAETVARRDTHGVNAGRRWRSWETSERCRWERKKTGDVNWIMMFEQTCRHDGTWRVTMLRDFGFLQKRTRVSHWQSRRVGMRHMPRASRVRFRTSQFQHCSITSNTAERSWPCTSNWRQTWNRESCHSLKHCKACCPFRMFWSLLPTRFRNTQFELKEERFLNASAANTIKLKHHGTRVVEGWTRNVNGAEIPLKVRFNVFDVKSPLLSTSKLRQHWYPAVLDQQQTIPKGDTTIVLTDQNGMPTLELRLATRQGEVDERMCTPVEEIGEEARRSTSTHVPRGPSDAERWAHEIYHMPYRSWCEYCFRERGKESPPHGRQEHSDDGIPVV